MNDLPTSKPASPRKKVSTTAKVVFFLVIAAVVLCGVLAIDIYLIASKYGAQVADPVKVKKVADKIVEMEEPLPTRFRYLMCLEVADMRSVAIDDSETGIGYTLLTKPRMSLKVKDEAILRSYIEHRETLGLEKTGFMQGFTPSSRGTLTVAGQSMPYAIGYSSMSKLKISQLIGVLTPTNKKTFVAFLAQSSTNRPLEMEDVQEFLKCIKRFK